MKKREFLAMGGAVPLMLAGCGDGAGSAPVRLVNASVGYQTPGLGFMDETTQAATGVLYGTSSTYFSAQAGSVSITLTTTVGGAEVSATAAQVRTINKDQRYSLVAYGILNELRFALVAESNVTPDTGNANINVLNTSNDIGPVDVYLSTTTDLSVSSLIASNIAASTASPAQSAFSGIAAGSYYITVVGAGSVGQGISDVRFQTPTPVTLTALEVVTIILTPGASGVLANAIVLVQGTTGSTTPFNNTTARVRAVTAVPGVSVAVTGTSPTGAALTLLAASTVQHFSNYFVVGTGTPPTVTVNGAPLAVVMNDPTSTATPPAEIAATLSAGGDYTVLVYLNEDGSGTPKAKIIADDNTAPTTSTGVKFRLINLASDNQGLQLSMQVNKLSIASNITYAQASNYTEISVPQQTPSAILVSNGPQAIISETTTLQLQSLVSNIFTEVVVSAPANGTAMGFVMPTAGTN